MGADAAEGVGKDSGMEERREGRWKGGAGDVGPTPLRGLRWRRVALPATHSGLTHTTRQGTHGSRHVHGPLCLPSSLAPLSFNPLAQGHP